MGGVWRRGLGHLPRKNHFVPKMMSVCILTIFNWQKKGTVTRSLGTRILWLSRETKLKQCKNYPKIHGQTRVGGGVAQSPPPPLNTPLIPYVVSVSFRRRAAKVRDTETEQRRYLSNSIALVVLQLAHARFCSDCSCSVVRISRRVVGKCRLRRKVVTVL